MARKGIASRGVFIDWYKWVTEKAHKEINTMSAYGIPLEELDLAAREQGVPLEELQ